MHNESASNFDTTIKLNIGLRLVQDWAADCHWYVLHGMRKDFQVIELQVVLEERMVRVLLAGTGGVRYRCRF